MVVGVNQQGQSAVLGVNRPTPFDIVLIGGLWTAQVPALRTAATGARVAVETARAQVWMPLVHAMGGGQNGLAVHDVGRVPPQGTSAGTPVLVVRDCGMRPPRGRVTSAPWQSVLTLLPYLSPVAPRLMRQARVVGVQRVSPDEATEIGRVIELPHPETRRDDTGHGHGDRSTGCGASHGLSRLSRAGPANEDRAETICPSCSIVKALEYFAEAGRERRSCRARGFDD